MPQRGDLRAADAVLRMPGCTIHVEAITRIVDVQYQLRQAQVKRRDLGADRLLILAGASTANRAALRHAAPVLAAAFPLGTRATLMALRENRDPGSDAIVVL